MALALAYSWGDYFSPTVVASVLCTAIASVMIPLVLHYLKARKEDRDRLFQIRREAYTEYFKRFEDASSDISYDFEKFQKETLPTHFRKLLESNSSPEAMVEFQAAVGEFPAKVMRSFEKINNEITGLQIVASPRVLELTNEFEAINRALLNSTTPWLEGLKQGMLTPAGQAPHTSEELVGLGMRLRLCRTSIVMQMRKELGANKA